MSRSCTLAEMTASFGPGVSFRTESAPRDVRVYAPFTEKHLLFQNLAIPLGDRVRTVLGSDSGSCDLVLVGGRISPMHAEIFYKDGCYFIQDLGSLHGTYVNGQKVGGVAELHAGDEIMVKPYTLVFSSSFGSVGTADVG
ncbi:MAG TPA: FHA domain-containing protein [Kiritimatiellia bacterium]|nr:FHA domain-containing protein [Kiritimatiellia bacterium]